MPTDPAKTRATRARYRAKHREKLRAKSILYNASHADELRAYAARRRAKHPEKVRAINAQSRAKHADKLRVKHVHWLATHPEKNSSYCARRRARLYNAPINDFTAQQWRDLKEIFQYRCAYCGKKPKRLQQDHITPLSKGGSHTLSNIVPACPSCNGTKQAGPVLRPVQPLLLTG